MNTSKKQARARLERAVSHETESLSARSTKTNESERQTLLQTEVEHSPRGETTTREARDAV